MDDRNRPYAEASNDCMGTLCSAPRPDLMDYSSDHILISPSQEVIKVKPLTTFNADEILREAASSLNISLTDLVAAAALWVHPEIHRHLLKETGSAAWFPHIRRARPTNELRGQCIEGILLDDNTFANNAIKLSITGSKEEFNGFETCHIWEKSCYDEKCHTALANLVLLPRSLASLSDHFKEVSAALQYRSWELYRWHPPGCSPPARPESYPKEHIWRPIPLPTDKATKALNRRIGKNGKKAV
jgi:hypothetical protein